MLLTQLVLQDYLKWRGMLLFRFLATAVDIEPEMSDFARTLLTRTIAVKFPDFLSQHFSEAVLVFNGCVTHPVYVSAAARWVEQPPSIKIYSIKSFHRSFDTLLYVISHVYFHPLSDTLSCGFPSSPITHHSTTHNSPSHPFSYFFWLLVVLTGNI